MGQALRKPRNPHIALVIEDQPEVRDLAAAILEETNLTVAEAANAEEALAFLNDHGSEVAMMFVDVKLPGSMDGVDLTRIAAELWPWIRCVVTSGAMDRPLNDLPRAARFMPKPWRALDVLVEAERAVAH
jgi:CheY-like chemotaxis protein